MDALLLVSRVVSETPDYHVSIYKLAE